MIFYNSNYKSICNLLKMIIYLKEDSKFLLQTGINSLRMNSNINSILIFLYPDQQNIKITIEMLK